MRRSTERILISHAGNLPRPQDLDVAAKAGDTERVRALVDGAVAGVVERQIVLGVDIVNDGEFPKAGGFVNYMHDRLEGFEVRDADQLIEPKRAPPGARDARDFPGVYESGLWNAGSAGPIRPGFVQPTGAPSRWPGGVDRVCVAPVRYTGLGAVRADAARLSAAIAGRDVEGCLTALGPLTLGAGLRNEHYASDEEYMAAVAEAVNEEYRAITEAGLIVQIDEPDLATGWQMYPDWSVEEYRRYLEFGVEILNHALEGVPEEQVRLHFCWGSGHRPHVNDIELRHIADLVLRVNAQCYSIEAANVRHAHDYQVWEDVRLPEGKILMPGAVAHATDLVEHPELIAERLVQYAERVGREHVQGGTDCGIGLRVGHDEVAWAKLAAMAEGARIASERLWP